MPDRVTWAQARRIALRSQGIGRGRREAAPDRRSSREALRRTIARTHLLQIDSVSVFARAHHMPVFTRAGRWDPAVLDTASAPGPRRLLVESLAHEAAYTTLPVHDLLAFRRRRAARKDWGAVRRAAGADPDVLAGIERTIAEHGPVSAAAVSRLRGDDRKPEQGWGWRRTDTQWIVEYLFRSGRLDCVGRNAAFERLYILAEDRAAAPLELDVGAFEPDAPDEDPAAVLELARRAAAALGIATPADIADYFRLPQREVAPALATLRASGELRTVAVGHPRGDREMLRWHEAPSAAPVAAEALVSPFDPVAFFRRRLAELFDVEYRIGIYTPREQRTHGYYPLPFLLGDRFEARVDLRADRARGVLEVCEVHREPLVHLGRRHRPEPAAVARALARELERAAAWQGLTAIEVRPLGDLAPGLAAALT
ncbi:winged helix DNA-binding domain-containing protein [Brachybacterium huguangmaarense]|uniref:Winged helix DNA-binding domain-containing protein n=1 Tax=Brachybacterium huguangmaarense TaxID=1652028 RepID=A0ABY6FYM3_9MICO|nr:crosslink repair DNA glycosylase YcaQ family protein [Brachybacterium huguangmaarense]UYG15716.1 winged helix DNA-binding domain-containing protein [Brachybacterium huguangmaarense]